MVPHWSMVIAAYQPNSATASLISDLGQKVTGIGWTGFTVLYEVYVCTVIIIGPVMCSTYDMFLITCMQGR